MAEASATGRKTVLPTTAGWARIIVTLGNAMAQARSSRDRPAVVRPVCRALSARVLRASKPNVETLGRAFRSTVPEASHIIALLQASSEAVERPVR